MSYPRRNHPVHDTIATLGIGAIVLGVIMALLWSLPLIIAWLHRKKDD